MAPVARRPCPWAGDGCGWLTPTNDVITSIDEALRFVELHNRDCPFNPTANRRLQEAQEDKVEERRYQRERRERREEEEKERTRLREEKLEEERLEDRAAKLRREAAAEAHAQALRDAELARQRADATPPHRHTAPPPPRTGPRPPAHDRPKIESEMTPSDFDLFKVQWEGYKTSTLEPNEYTAERISGELWQCCPNTLQTSLLSHSLNPSSTVEELLTKIELLWVKAINVRMNREEFYRMRQRPSENCRQYSSRLKDKARYCNFTVPVGQTSYLDQMVLDQLIKGLNDPAIKSDITEIDARKKLDLASTENIIEAKENTKQGLASLEGVEQLAKVSDFQRGKQASGGGAAKGRGGGREAQGADRGGGPQKCKYCNRTGHGRNPNPEERKQRCPAHNKVCGECNKRGHLSSVCRGAGRSSAIELDNELHGATGSFCLIHSGPRSHRQKVMRIRQETAPIPHVVMHKGKWQRARGEPHPYQEVEVSVHTPIYESSGVEPPASSGTIKVLAMLDTGAQMCLLGPDVLSRLGVTTDGLVRTSTKMHAANGKEINILGSIFLNIKLNDNTNAHMCYVTDQIRGLYLSQTALKDIGVIPGNFPEQIAKCTANDDEDDDGKGCDCPVRVEAPDPPEYRPGASPEELEELIKTHYADSAFNRCERQSLPVMEDVPVCRLHLKKDAVPFAIHRHRPVAMHWEKEVKKDLDRDVAMGVIRGPLVGGPATWCAPMHITAKKNGKPRRTIDFQMLNKACVRQTHPTKAPFLQCSSVPAYTIRTTLDAWNGYHSVPLLEADRHLTAFLTPWGRYEYCNLPQGHMAAGDAYTARYDAITVGFERMERCIDDTIMWDDSVEANFHRVCAYLTHCSRQGITFNEEKFAFGRKEIEFLGFIITEDSVKPSKEMIESIQDFPEPRDLTGVRSWHGLINQVNCFHSDPTLMLPFKTLLSSKETFAWTAEASEAFKASKAKIVDAIKNGIKTFSMDRETVLATDWSRVGIGFHLSQKRCRCTDITPTCCAGGWKTVFAGSRFTTGAESRYHPVEGEALAVAWALQKTKHFTLGNDRLTIAVDHKPLLKIFGDRELGEIENTRLLNFKEKTLRWKFRVVYVPGKEHSVPDALSRHPVEKPLGFEAPWAPRRSRSCLEGSGSQEDLDTADIEAASEAATERALDEALGEARPAGRAAGARASVGRAAGARASVGRAAGAGPGIRGRPRRPAAEAQHRVSAATSPRKIGTLRVDEESHKDPEIKELHQLVEAGAPEEAEEWPRHLRAFFRKGAEYSTINNSVLVDQRLVMPRALRLEALALLHSGHGGVRGMEARAREAMFWPGMTTDIQRLHDDCQTCRSIAPSQPAQPPKPLPTPDYPFQMVCSDYFQEGAHHYLVLVCRYSNWLTVYKAKDSTTKELVSRLREYMGTFGVMDEIATDGASVYLGAEVQEFLARLGVHHRVSSAYNPHSNQRAEGAVKAARRMIRDNIGPSGTLDTDRFLAALLAQRNMPDPGTGLSSSEVLFGRRISDFMPIDPRKLRVRAEWHTLMQQREAAMARRHLKRGEELGAHCRTLTPLKLGDAVSVQNQHGNKPLRWDTTGIVVETGDFDKYTVKLDGSGRLTTRNRQFLKPIPCYKEAISRPAPAAPPPVPAAGPGPAEAAVPPPPPTAAAPRRSARVAKRTAATSRRPSHQQAPSVAQQWRAAHSPR